MAPAAAEQEGVEVDVRAVDGTRGSINAHGRTEAVRHDRVRVEVGGMITTRGEAGAGKGEGRGARRSVANVNAGAGIEFGGASSFGEQDAWDA